MFACGEGRYLGIVDSMGHASKTLFENWNQIENFYTRNTSNAKTI